MRTGIILAAYLARHAKIDGEEAIRRIRSLRPTSTFSPEGMKAVQEYAASFNES